MMGMNAKETKLNNMNEPTDSEALPRTPCSAFWWIMGTVVIDEGYVCLARKHRFLRYVQAWSWGRWNGIREEYPQIPKSFEQNAIAQTPPTAVDLPRLVRQSYFGTVRLTIGCMDRMCQVTYYNEKREKQDIRGTSQEVADHINSLLNTPAQENQTN